MCMHQGVVAAHPKFVPLKELDAHPKRYLRNDTLIIRCGRQPLEYTMMWEAARVSLILLRVDPSVYESVKTQPAS